MRSNNYSGNSTTLSLKLANKGILVLDHGTSNLWALSIRVRNDGTLDYIPDNITIENCDIYANASVTAQGIGVTNSGTPAGRPSGMIFRNNKIPARHRGIFLNYSGTAFIYNNEFYINQTTSGYTSGGIVGNSGA